MVQKKGTYPHPDLIKIDLSKDKSHTTQSALSCHIEFKEEKKWARKTRIKLL